MNSPNIVFHDNEVLLSVIYTVKKIGIIRANSAKAKNLVVRVTGVAVEWMATRRMDILLCVCGFEYRSVARLPFSFRMLTITKLGKI